MSAPLATAVVLLLQLATIRLVLTADEERAYFLGRPITAECALRARFGLPCPTCGITRGVALTLHGEVRQAWRIYPAAPVAIFGMGAFAAALIVLAWVDRRGPPRAAALLQSRLRKASLGYAGMAAMVWLAGWIAALAKAAFQVRG